MASTAIRMPPAPIHPVHGVLLAGTLPLFLGALFSDIAYARSYEIQWANFASWLIAGGLVFAGFALLWAFVELFRADRRGGKRLLAFLLLLGLFVIGLVNALVHAKDAWAAMPDGLILSVVTAALSFAAIWVGFSSLRTGGSK